MHGDDLPHILSVVSIVLTLIVVMYARGTIMEARRTTAEERSAVIQLRAAGTTGQPAVLAGLPATVGARTPAVALIDHPATSAAIVYTRPCGRNCLLPNPLCFTTRSIS